MANDLKRVLTECTIIDGPTPSIGAQEYITKFDTPEP